MRKAIYSLIITAVMLLNSIGCFAVTAANAEIHVSSTGNDMATGDVTSPVATFKRAAELAIQINNEEKCDVVVYFHAGDYRMDPDSRVIMDESDSAVDGTTITYCAYGDGDVNFKGSVLLDSEEFEIAYDHEALEKLPTASRGRVLVADLDGIGFNASKGTYRLFADSVEQILSQWPNVGYAVNGSSKTTGYLDCTYSRAYLWQNAPNAYVAGYYKQNYARSSGTISGVSDGKLYLSGESEAEFRAGSSYRVYNLLEEVDMPGEYYVDISDKKLYYYPSHDIDGAVLELTTMHTNPFVYMNGTKNITFSGLNFMHSVAGGIAAVNADNVHVYDCGFSHLLCYQEDIDASGWTSYKNYAVCLWGSNSSVKSCDFFRLGNGAVNCFGGNRFTKESANIDIVNNRVSECGYLANNSPDLIKAGSSGAPSSGAASPYGYGINVSHNIVHDCSNSCGISIVANDSYVNYNEIYSTSRESEDTGAIYMGRNHSRYGTEVAYNYIHDILVDDNYGRSGIYLDDMYSGTSVHHNILENVDNGVLAAAGHNNTYKNNIFVNCNDAFAIGTRGISMPDSEHYSKDGYCYKELESCFSQSSDYETRYDGLSGMLTKNPYGAPWGTSFIDNIMIGSTPAFNTSSNLVVNEVNVYGSHGGNTYLAYSDSLFNDAANHDFTIAAGSSAAAAIPELVSSMGTETIGFTDEATDRITSVPTNTFDMRTPVKTDAGILVSWDYVKGAGDYILEFATDAGFTDILLTETVQANGVCNTYEYAGSVEDNVYVRASAVGNSRQTPFTVVSTTAVLDDSIRTEIDSITSFTVKSNGSIFTAEGTYIAGYPITVAVTNPGRQLSSLGDSNAMEILQYFDVVTCDRDGKFSFSFDTVSEGEDYSGTYTVYLSNLFTGLSRKLTYYYGMFSSGEVTFSDASGAIEDVRTYAGKEVTIGYSVHNGLEKAVDYRFVCAIYDGDQLIDCFYSTQQTADAKSGHSSSINVKMPDDMGENSKIKCFYWNGFDTLEPLTKARLIVE